MSMIVRKATLIRPGRSRRGQSQRSQHNASSRDSHGISHGVGISSRTSASRSTFSGAFPLKSLLPRTSTKPPPISRRQSTMSGSKASAHSSQSFLSRQLSGGDRNQEDSPLKHAEHSSRNEKEADVQSAEDPTKPQRTPSTKFESTLRDMSDFRLDRLDRNSIRQLLSIDAVNLLSPPQAILERPGVPLRHVGSSLKESDLSKPESDLPFKRSDLPVRHSSLPARRLDTSDYNISAAAAECLGAQRRENAPVVARHISLPRRYLDLPRTHLDYPLRRPDSEQAYRELAEREHLHRSLIEAVYLARDARFAHLGATESGGLLLWGSQTDLYQGSGEWRRPSVDQCQRSELLQQVLEANKDADGPLDFVCRVTDILSTTVVMTVLLFMTLAVPVVMITMGVKYLDDCPLQRRVPVYLLVGGCFLALKLVGMLWKNLQLRRYDSMDAFYDSPDSELAFPSRTFRVMDWILAAFLLAWHIAGACWVFSIWRPPFQPSLHQPSQYCGSAVYLCALVEIASTGGLLVIMLLVWLGLALCYKYTNLFEQ